VKVEIKRIGGEEITGKEMSLLVDCNREVKEDLETLLDALAFTSAQAWRITSQTGSGIMITRVNDKLLFVWHLAGQGLFRCAKSLLKEVKMLALENGLEGVAAQVSNPTLERFYVKHDFVARHFVEWRPYGRR
jgi:hypothetical protein